MKIILSLMVKFSNIPISILTLKRIEVQKTKVIAHRGASHESPENTLASIRRAIDLNVDCIEIDVHLSKDHVPVVIHDDTVERTTSSKEKLRITDLTLQEIKKLDAGSWYNPSFKDENIPTLKEVLELDFKGCNLMIEMKKSPFPAPLVAEKNLKDHRRSKTFQSFNFGKLRAGLIACGPCHQFLNGFDLYCR